MRSFGESWNNHDSVLTRTEKGGNNFQDHRESSSEVAVFLRGMVRRVIKWE